MVCPNCGASLPDTAKMCYSCKMDFQKPLSEKNTAELISSVDPTQVQMQQPQFYQQQQPINHLQGNDMAESTKKLMKNPKFWFVLAIAVFAILIFVAVRTVREASARRNSSPGYFMENFVEAYNSHNIDKLDKLIPDSNLNNNKRYYLDRCSKDKAVIVTYEFDHLITGESTLNFYGATEIRVYWVYYKVNGETSIEELWLGKVGDSYKILQY